MGPTDGVFKWEPGYPERLSMGEALELVEEGLVVQGLKKAYPRPAQSGQVFFAQVMRNMPESFAWNYGPATLDGVFYFAGAGFLIEAGSKVVVVVFPDEMEGDNSLPIRVFCSAGVSLDAVQKVIDLVAEAFKVPATR